MNNDQFIAAFKKALAGLDKSSQKDIVQEIKSHAAESGDPLFERFGSPEDLARQYLDGEKIAVPLGEKIWGISKKLFIGIGMAAVALAIVVSIIVWWWTRDPFNYADESAEELGVNKAAWQSFAWSDDLHLDVERASVVIYWHDELLVRSNCKIQDPPKVEGAKVSITRGKCLVYLPKVVTQITAEQAEIVLVRPQVSLDMEIKQTELRVAANGERYRYIIDGSRTKIDDLPSHEDAALELRIKSSETRISAYSY